MTRESRALIRGIMGSQKTVYIEHSALAHEAWHDELRKAFGPGSDRIPVFSEWSLVEIANGRDLPQAIRRAELIDNLPARWMEHKWPVQRKEVQNFVFEASFGLPARRVLPFHDTLCALLVATETTAGPDGHDGRGIRSDHIQPSDLP